MRNQIEPRNNLDSSSINTSHIDGDASMMQEQRNLLKDQNQQFQQPSTQNKGADAYKKPDSHPQTGPRRIKIEYGPGAVQDLIYKYKDNTVRTTKYTLATWAPKSLILQFRKIANVYFLIISILTMLSFSPKKPASQIMTFLLVLISTMLKEGYEDLQRYKQDKEANMKPATVYDFNQKKFVTKSCYEVLVGDLVKISKDEPFPADILLLASSNTTGIAFVDTMNLDGETNLKEKICPKQTKDLTEMNFAPARGTLDCDSPNEYLDSWEGNIKFGNDKFSVSIKNLGLRGTTLRNTQYVLGYCVYTGHSTKIMKNSKNPPSKMSAVLKKMNTILYSVFILQGFIIITFASASVNWQGKNSATHTYLNLDTNVNFGTFLVRVFTYLVAYSHLIPISLYVALEILKLLEGNLIKNDADMYWPELDKYANVRSSDLVEELGQIEFIFSDKTGTLTKNEMEFKKCSINFEVYGECSDEAKQQRDLTINGDSTAYELLTSHGENKHRRSIRDFFLLLAVCHTVMPEVDPKTGKIKYQASSPDELALVLGAAKMGFRFLERTSSNITIETPTDGRQTWEVICEFPFDSTRKRMSLIVRNPAGEFYIMTKGADSIILPRIILEKGGQQIVQKHLDQFAVDGLRTLVVGQKLLTYDLVENFMRNYEAAKMMIGAEKETALNNLYDSLEKGLELVGCTAIEDKLQDGVPETIASLIEADIRVWVLTGDKQETAIEIGKSCRLIVPGMEQVILSSTSEAEFKTKLDKNVTHYLVNLIDPIPPLEELSKQLIHKICIIIDGSTLVWAMRPDNKEIQNKFFRLALLANSVICCRVSPKQKADVVHLAKSNGPWKTLSIGDGANDVSMIMEAHIGVGVYGKEGTQAVRSADFAIAQFSYLKKLLLFHGRVTYRRISTFILYYFYKNVIVVFTEIYFAFYNGFSGQIFFADWLPMLYNSFWTSWPCMSNYLLDRDVNKENSFKYPKLYKAGPKHYYFNMMTFWGWMGFALWHGIICFFLPVFGLTGVNDSTGLVKGHWWVSTISFCLIMHVITMKLFIQTTYWNRFNLTIAFISIFFYYICLLIICADGMAKVIQPELNGVIYNIFASGRAWIVILFIPWVAVGPDIIFLVFKKIIRPNPSDKVLRLILQNKRTLPMGMKKSQMEELS